MANAATWIRNVAGIPRNDVDVKMWNRLAGRRADVDADVETVRRLSSLQDRLRAGNVNSLSQGARS